MCNCNLSLEGEVAEHVLHYPATDYTVVRINDEWYNEREDSEEAPFTVDFLVSSKRAFLSFTTNCNFCNKKCKTKCKSKSKINNEEETSAVFCCKIRETPDVSQTNGRTGCRKNEPD